MMTARTFLIADSGGTKASWALARDGKVIWQQRTPGLPPSFLTDAEIIGLAKSIADQLVSPIEGVYFYGTGCREVHASARMKKLLQYVFPKFPSKWTPISSALRGRYAVPKKGSPAFWVLGRMPAIAQRARLCRILGDWASFSAMKAAARRLVKR
ncbi:MAG: hypothetical protein ACKV1O_30200 [Saprospiraceae bacterium]